MGTTGVKVKVNKFLALWRVHINNNNNILLTRTCTPHPFFHDRLSRQIVTTTLSLPILLCAPSNRFTMSCNITNDPVSDHVQRHFERLVVKYPGLARGAASMRASASRSDMSTETSIERERESSSPESTSPESDSSESGSSESTETAPSHPAIITLNVGGRHFMVSAAVLVANSGLFHRQLSAHRSWNPQPDGAYFVDADPDLFAHLLAFMRRPSVFPVLYTPAAGFDYALYNRLEAEAEHFEIGSLSQWIRDREFERAVKVYTHISMTEEIHGGDETTFTTGGTGEIKIVSLQSICDEIPLAY